MPAMALEQPRRGVKQERQDQSVGFGELERLLEGAFGGTGVAERVVCDRFQQEGVDEPDSRVR
jgi:hypothetical protein